MNYQAQKSRLPQRCKALEWHDDPTPAQEQTVAEKEVRARFWAKVARPIYGTRILTYQESQLHWD